MIERELKEYRFHIEGHGYQPIPCAPVVEDSEEKAFREAQKQVKRLKLPGWTLVCDTTGNSVPAAEFVQIGDDGKPTKVRA